MTKEWPQLVALKIPEIKEEIEKITGCIFLERLQPKLTMFSGKTHILEMQFLGDVWKECCDEDKQTILNHYQTELQKVFGDWIIEVREFAI